MNIGILGGSFNPIHIGHRIVAEEVFNQKALSKILFIPTGISPHKESGELIDASHRYQMVKDAIRDNDHFEISDLEIKRAGKSYTIDTVRTLKEMYGEKYTFSVIIGSDMVHEINTWKDIGTLLGMCHFIVVNRPPVSAHEDLLPQNMFSGKTFTGTPCGEENGDSLSLTERRGIQEKNLLSRLKADIERFRVRVPPIGISSTEIRERLRNGRSIRYLVPRCVEDYIRAYDLYREK
ncbi:MAG: nicotinate-nucleotide adenylyltransferase [wastewater metagenome]|nr:nicotinate-nucleotide adenylyltransferase [Candidatus Loosdrechtia aerotolerans]